jgi:hypothetical protein
MKTVLVPLMLLTAGTLMSFAWIGHLKFKSLTFLGALAMSWSMVLPEYILNVYSVRWGGIYFLVHKWLPSIWDRELYVLL